MKELIEFLACSLVDDPNHVVVEEQVRNNGLAYHLSVAKGDMGKVIGKQGSVAKALRSVVGASAAKVNKRIVIDIG